MHADSGLPKPQNPKAIAAKQEIIDLRRRVADQRQALKDSPMITAKQIERLRATVAELRGFAEVAKLFYEAGVEAEETLEELARLAPTDMLRR